jgi:hypothetical protein
LQKKINYQLIESKNKKMEKEKKEQPLNNTTDDKITIQMSRRDVAAFAVLMNSGVVGVGATRDTMKLAVSLPPDIDKYFDTIVKDGGVFFERVMKLSRDKWRDGIGADEALRSTNNESVTEKSEEPALNVE